MKNLILFFKSWYMIIWECFLHACGSSYFHNTNWLLFQWTTSLEWNNTMLLLPTSGSLWSTSWSWVAVSRFILQDMLSRSLPIVVLTTILNCCPASSPVPPRIRRTPFGPRPQTGLWTLNAPPTAPLTSRLVQRHNISQYSMQGSRLFLYI